jgi:peptidase M50-like protein
LQRPPSPTMMGQQHMTSWSDFAWWLTFLNVFMAGFNLLPAFPSDGGRVFRAFLSLFVSRLAATKVAVYTGAVMALGLAIIGIGVGIVQLPFIAVLFAFIGQMELWMLRRQADLRGQAYAESMRLSAERSAALEPPEPDFSGYSWDADSRAWVEWRNGVAVRKCRMRVG